ncbi:hypothetical protein CEXT_184241 [Caerostris extrusa]|uniref:Uncharacterized protein n=1 Tax=Caerostris extrusa TaxID=172846 RepID=A0AAV4S377_CAEEX|nr:hypothetical protein CEXT_184241 [Caerostris extrusa]
MDAQDAPSHQGRRKKGKKKKKECSCLCPATTDQLSHHDGPFYFNSEYYWMVAERMEGHDVANRNFANRRMRQWFSSRLNLAKVSILPLQISILCGMDQNSSSRTHN